MRANKLLRNIQFWVFPQNFKYVSNLSWATFCCKHILHCLFLNCHPVYINACERLNSYQCTGVRHPACQNVGAKIAKSLLYNFNGNTIISNQICLITSHCSREQNLPQTKHFMCRQNFWLLGFLIVKFPVSN